jgi:DNA-binding winged helix-turn-helix (wHTH) protein
VPSKEVLVSLLALPLPWSAQSGLPKETVLRRLCEWAICGGFPEGAFRDVHDNQIRPFDIYMSHRAILETSLFSSGVRLGGSTIFNSGWGPEVLQGVLVRSGDLEFFSEKTDTEPIWETRAGVFSFLKRPRLAARAHLAPPPCPDAEAFAIRFDAKQSADATMNTMKGNLNRLSGKDQRWKRVMGNVEERSIDFDKWNLRWASDVKSVLGYLELAPDSDLKERLQRLDSEWETFRKENEPAASRTPSAAAEAHVQLRIFPTEQRIILHGRETYLPEKQFKLLCCLAEAALTARSVVANRKIENRIWGEETSNIYRTVGDVVRDLRNTLKAADHSRDPTELIKNRPGQGYSLNLPASAIVIEPADANANTATGSSVKASHS